MPKWNGRWAGGRTYLDGRRTIYVLEKMRGGVRYTETLDARNEEEAERELAAFERDPAGFKALPDMSGKPLALSAKTIQPVLDWQASENQSHGHRYATRLYLKKWADALAGRDLNTVTPVELERHLDAWETARKLRVVAMMTFCTFYAKRGELENNPAPKLRVPKFVAAKHIAPRHYKMEEVERAYRSSNSQVQRDLIQLGCKTGLHVTEIERFAAGVGRLVEVKGQGEIAGVLWVLHKRGEQHPNSLDAAALAAAMRVRDRGGIPSRQRRQEYVTRLASKISRVVGKEVRPVHYGALRHSFITWARSEGGRVVRPVNYGVTLDEIRDAVGHRSTRTTSGYDGTEIPPMIVVPVKLEHPSDPKVVEPGTAPRVRTRAPRLRPRRGA